MTTIPGREPLHWAASSYGADVNWVPDYSPQTALDIAGTRGTRRENVITWLREQGAKSSSEDRIG